MNFKTQIQRSLPDYEKAAKEFYEKKNFNQLIVKAIKKKTMNFNVSINCDNAAFDDDLTGIEICRILGSISDKLQDIGYIEPQENMNGRIRDMNGNTVGSWEFTQ